MALNLSRLFPRLSIRSKLIFAFAGLSVLPLILVGLHGVFSNAKLMENNAFENLTHDVQTIRENTANFLGNIESDLRVIRHSSSLTEIVADLEQFPQPANRTHLEHLQSELLAFAQTKTFYYQLRLVNNEGDELLRIEADDDTRYRSVAAGDLHHAREAFYVLLVDSLSSDQIAFAPAELVDRDNRRIPVVSFAMPLLGSHGRAGILIANVYAKSLFHVIETDRHLPVPGTIMMVNSDGHYLYHSDKKKDWNKLLASRQEDNLQHDYPNTLVKLFLSGKEGNTSEGIDEIVSYAPLFSPPASLPVNGSATSFVFPYFIIESVSKSTILQPVRFSAFLFAGLMTVFLAIAVGLGLLATQQFTKPIAELRRGAEVISKGAYNHRINIITHDEIEDLADQFNTMALSLESHEREIQLHRTRLEEMVRLRTLELSEEKTKLQTILDHVPSAVVLYDKDFRIQSASAAFSAITHQALGDVRGKNCYELLCGNGFCLDCVGKRAFLSKHIESHTEQIPDSNGEELFLEHLAIPMNDSGNAGSILEIITDVTERKRLERHLLRTEKLAAAGEMSAIIAHEFRNALTSIKMILQLQRESQRLSRPEKNSLAVALDSIAHMEQIVKELLDFARPRPMEFRAQPIKKIVNDSLALAQLHISKRTIKVKKNYEPDIPPIMIDESHLKEALMNIFLNAAQAIEIASTSKTDRISSESLGEIHVSTKKVRLGKTLRDFAFPRDAASEQAESSGHEIVLKRGSECGLIEITDTGCGIDPLQVARIFDPFFTTKPYGTGLGLPMVKRTINSHGGVVTVKSRINRGTTFSLYFPLDRRM